MPVRFTVDGRTFSAQGFLFDKDGTLLAFDHWLSVMRERAHRLGKRLELSTRETEALLRFMGVDPETGRALPQGIIHLPRCDAEAQVAAYLAGRLSVPEAEAVVADVFQEVDQEFPFERYIRPAPGAEELLVALRKAGGRVAVVTHDSAAATKRHLAALGWDGLVDTVVGTDICPARKPAPEPVLRACAALDVPPEQGVMVGDSPNDLLAGRNAGCLLAVGVLTGLGRPEELFPLADILLPDLSEIRLI